MLGTMSPEVLMTRVANGDREAFRTVYRLLAPTLLGVALSLLRDRDLAQDVVQEAFVRVWEKATSYDGEKGAVVAWAVIIVRRLALNEIRRRRTVMVPVEDAEAEVDALLSIERPDPSGQTVRLKRCLEALDPDYRRAILLTYHQGLTNEDMADQLGRPLGTVKSWVRRGLVDLKDCVG
jgi:RNA polymerase sigma-70 factor (ECF subfamily)